MSRLLFVFALTAALTLLFLGVRLPLDSWLLGLGDDPKSSVWFLQWWPWAVRHGTDPFWSRLVFAPAGYSMAWATSLPSAALLALPATLVAGPVASFDLLTLAAPALGATTLALLAFEVTASVSASLVAGLLFAFSGYEDGQLIGHLNLDEIFLVPLLPLLVIRRHRGVLARPRFLLLFVTVLLGQFGFSSEIFATAVSLGLATLLLFAAFAPKPIRRSLLRIAAECVGAVGCVAVLALPMLFSMAQDRIDMPGFINDPRQYSNDLLNLVVPTAAQRLSPPAAQAIAARFTGNSSEQDLYLGLPLLAIVALFGLDCDGRRWRLLTVATFAGLVVASLGPRLHVAGIDTGLPLPWLAAVQLPLLDGALPCRIGLYVALTASVAASIWMAGRPARTLFGLLACVPLVPGAAAETWSKIERPCLFGPAAARAAFEGRTVLLLPFASGDAMVWQALSRMSFPQAGGLLSFVPLSFQRDPLVWPLVRNQAEPSFGTDLTAFVRRHNVRFVAEGPGTSEVLHAALGRIGWPHRDVCGVDLTTVPP